MTTTRYEFESTVYGTDLDNLTKQVLAYYAYAKQWSDADRSTVGEELRLLADMFEAPTDDDEDYYVQVIMPEVYGNEANE